MIKLEDYDPASALDETNDDSNRKDAHQSKKHQKKKLKKKMKKNTVSFKYNVKLAKINQQRDWGSWLSGFFGGKSGTSIKDLAVVEHVPEQENCPKNEYYTTVQAG